MGKETITIQRKYIEKLIKYSDEMQEMPRDPQKYFQLIGYISSLKEIL